MLTLFVSGFALIGAAALVLRRRYVRGTTLVGPWSWCVTSLITLAAVELGLAVSAADRGAAVWRFLSATSTLCPGIALLGAKRPQDRAWQWIVGSLWFILALPAIQQILAGRSGELDIHPARIWFTIGLLIFCALNSIWIQRWWLVMMAAVGQSLLLAPYGMEVHFDELLPSLGITLLALVATLTLLPRSSPSNLDGLDSVWIDFRQMFGLVWALRFIERTNSVAQANDWDLQLAWTGFRNRAGTGHPTLSPDEIRVLQQSMRNLLRRFVSREWIDARMK